MNNLVQSSRSIFDQYIEKSWRTNALRQREKGVEFVIGKRQGPYLWNLEGTRKVIDCGLAGGVHSLGHRHPEVITAVTKAIQEGRDTGLWSLPNAEYLRLQELLARNSPNANLGRSLITHCSTMSVDVAIMFAFRTTGRKKILAYRHGYHGHSGFAALVTGSLEEGILDHYRLPNSLSRFFTRYNDINSLSEVLGDDIAGVIIEPMEYETFASGTKEFLRGVERLCAERGALLIIDETRTGLGRTGKLWATEHFGLAPDMLIIGKGLSGGIYPVSALLVRDEIYEQCINEHKYSYISSLGGNEIACIVARRVVELSSEPEFLRHVNRIGELMADRLGELCEKHRTIAQRGTNFGCIATIQLLEANLAPLLFRAAYENGVLCHSISVIAPRVLKLMLSLVIDEEVVDEIAEGIDRALTEVSRMRN